jgi:hypothetical protein
MATVDSSIVEKRTVCVEGIQIGQGARWKALGRFNISPRGRLTLQTSSQVSFSKINQGAIGSKTNAHKAKHYHYRDKRFISMHSHDFLASSKARQKQQKPCDTICFFLW